MSADASLPMCFCTVPIPIDGADDPKTESWCFALAITGQDTRLIVYQFVFDKSDNEEIPSATLSINYKLNFLCRCNHQK